MAGRRTDAYGPTHVYTFWSFWVCPGDFVGTLGLPSNWNYEHQILCTLPSRSTKFMSMIIGITWAVMKLNLVFGQISCYSSISCEIQKHSLPSPTNCGDSIKGTRWWKIEGRYFLIIANIIQDTNGKSIYQKQNVCDSIMFKAIQANGEGCDVRKSVIQLSQPSY